MASWILQAVTSCCLKRPQEQKRLIKLEFVCLVVVVVETVPPWPGSRAEMLRCFTGDEAHPENLAGKSLGFPQKLQVFRRN